MEHLEIGTIVRHLKWRNTGTIVNIEWPSIFMAWHNSFVECQLDAGDVELVSDPPLELREWRGVVGRLGGVTDAYQVIPVAGR